MCFVFIFCTFLCYFFANCINVIFALTSVLPEEFLGLSLEKFDLGLKKFGPWPEEFLSLGLKKFGPWPKKIWALGLKNFGPWPKKIWALA